MKPTENESGTADIPDPQGTAPHLSMERILVPIDFTPAALHALRYSARMAQKMGGRCPNRTALIDNQTCPRPSIARSRYSAISSGASIIRNR